MANTEYDFAISEASSSATGGVNTAEGQDPSTVNDGLRAWKQLRAARLDDEGGVVTVGGTGDVITVTLAEGFTAYGTGAGQIDTGAWFRFPASAANTTNVTLNINGIGAKAIRKISGGTDVALAAGDLAAGETYTVIYRASANSAAGAWVLVGAASVSLNTLWAKGADVASATTTALGSGNWFHITGTTTITDIDFSSALDGRMAWVEFDGALTLTHNGTTLNLPGGANITTAAGDRAVLVQDSGDNIHVLSYQRATGAPSGGINLSATTASTSGTSIDFTGIPAWAKRITVNFNGVSTSATAEIIIQIGTSGGVQTTNYLGTWNSIANAGPTTSNATTGFNLFTNGGGAGFTRQGAVTLTLVDASTGIWTASGVIGLSDSGRNSLVAGTKSLSGVLDRVRITTTGADTFDAGSVNIMWE